MALDPAKILISPLLTEKSTNLKEDLRQYSFRVTPDSSKGDIKRVVEDLFKVKVLKIRTMTVFGKWRRMGRYQGRRPDWKKALVTVDKGQKIDFEKA